MAEQQKEIRKLLEDLQVDIKDSNSDYHVPLKGFETIKQFFKQESDFWNQTVKISSGMLPALRSHFNHINSLFTQFTNGIEDGSITTDNLQQRWLEIQSKIEVQKIRNNQRILYSKTIEGQLIFELFTESSAQVEGAYKYFNNSFIFQIIGNQLRPHQMSEQEIREQLVGFIRAYEIDHQRDSRLLRRRDLERRSLGELKSQIEQTLNDLKSTSDAKRSELDKWIKEIKEKINEWQNKSSKQWSELVENTNKEIKQLMESYSEFLKFEGPTKYWRERANKYTKHGRWWLAGLSLTITIVILLLLMILYEMPDAFHHKVFQGEPEAIKGFIILAAIISFGAYLSKVFSKLTFSSFHIQRDAEEREQLTLVYLALLKESDLTEKERDIIMQALFSRVETGLLGSDSSPSMPGGMDNLFDKLFQKK